MLMTNFVDQTCPHLDCRDSRHDCRESRQSDLLVTNGSARFFKVSARPTTFLTVVLPSGF